MLVLSLAYWTMREFAASRPSPLPALGNPMPTLVPVTSSLTEEAELSSAITLLTREDVDGAVKVAATYASPLLFSAMSRLDAAQQGGDETEVQRILRAYWLEHDLDRYLVFSLTLDSSGPDLTSYRPDLDVRLRTASGQEVGAETWTEHPSPAPNHHRLGMLHFPREAPDGRWLLNEDVAWFELRLGTVDGEERTLRWERPAGDLSAISE